MNNIRLDNPQVKTWYIAKHAFTNKCVCGVLDANSGSKVTASTDIYVEFVTFTTEAEWVSEIEESGHEVPEWYEYEETES